MTRKFTSFKLGEKGSSRINRVSVECKDPSVCTVPGQQVHQDCRRIYCNPIKIADAIWAKLTSDVTLPTGEVQYVLDGDALIHRIPWPRGSPTYREMCNIRMSITQPRSMERQSLSLRIHQYISKGHDTAQMGRRQSRCNRHIFR